MEMSIVVINYGVCPLSSFDQKLIRMSVLHKLAVFTQEAVVPKE